MSKGYAIAAVGVLGAVLAGTVASVIFFGANSDDQFAQCRGSQVGGGAIGGPFELVDETGQSVTHEDVITGPTLIYFGYTFCPDACPLDNVRNAQAIEILESQGIDEVQPVFITIDPERDDVETVRAFTDNFHDRMLGLTGSQEQIDAVTSAYRVIANKQDTGDEFYLVDHTTMTYLMHPEEGLLEFYRRDTSPERMAESLACFVEADVS
ncbi:MAG: SCO family protein [Pseudomonadota bacterium]